MHGYPMPKACFSDPQSSAFRSQSSAQTRPFCHRVQRRTLGIVDKGFCYPSIVRSLCVIRFRLEAPLSVLFNDAIALHHCLKKVCDGPSKSH